MPLEVQIKLDSGAIASLEEKLRMAGEMTVEALRTEVVSSAVMPFDTGNLQNNLMSASSGFGAEKDKYFYLITQGPYARRLYHNPQYNFQQGNNANAQGKWLRHWLPGGDKEAYVRDTYKQILEDML